MSDFRFYASVALATILCLGSANAQSSASPDAASGKPAASTTRSTKPGTSTEVETWTNKQWQAAKKEWAKDETKWAGCRSQSGKQKLAGRKSWSFLYTCMAS